MSNLQTSTIRVPKEVLDSIKIYCKKNGKNVGDWVETAWNFIQKNDFDIYDQEATPFLPVQEQPQGKEVAALCKLMVEFINTANQQKQLPESEINNREKEIERLEMLIENNHELMRGYQDRLERDDEEKRTLRKEISSLSLLLEKAKNELRQRNKGIFNKPDEQVLRELGIY